MARILVVDDWPINREFLSTLLRYAGHVVSEAADGAAALAVMREDVPDLLITDILMPTMDGTELARRAAADPALAGVPIIFYTAAYRLSEATSLAHACGVTTVLPKPSEPQHVLDAVHGELGLPLIALTAAVQLQEHERGVTHHLQRAYLDQLGGLRTTLQTTVQELGPPMNGEAHRLKRVITRVDESFLLAQSLSMRLATLIELGIELSRRSGSADMLDIFCRGARDVLSCSYAVACVLDEGGRLLDMVARGYTPEQERSLRAQLDPTSGVFGDLLRDGRTRGIDGPRASAEHLPSDHPRVPNLLAVRIASRNRSFGWFFVAGTIGDGFAASDRHLAEILGAQLATQYENQVLLDRTRRHAGLLEAEIDERRAAEARLRESELRFRELAENIREVFFLVDMVTGNVLYVSPAYADVYQRSVESLLAAPQSWLDAVHPDDREHTLGAFGKAQEAGSFSFEYRIVRPDASVRWIRARGFPILHDDGRPYRIAGLAEDVTEPKVQELRIKRLSRILSVLSNINSTIVRTRERPVLLDEACRIAFEDGGFPIVWVAWHGADRTLTVAASRGIDEATAKRAEEYGRTARASEWAPARESFYAKHVVLHRDLRAAAAEHMGPIAQLALAVGCKSLASLPLLIGNELVGAILLYARDPELFDTEEMALLRELAGNVSFALQYIAKEEEADYLAYHDPLTGLANGSLFNERIAQMVESKPRKAALYLIDLDRFTDLNDSLGRHVGDQLLTAVTERLQGKVPEPTLLGRVGADTFAIGVSALRSDSEAGTILEDRVLSVLNQPFDIDGHEIRASARAGVAVYPTDGLDSEALFKNAEAALNEARTTNARFAFYSPQLNARVAEDLALEQQLRGALERGEFRLFYQPKVTAKSGELAGVEALLRWQRPEGIVPPDRFIRVLEDSELIVEVGQWVIAQALRDYRAWEQLGLNPPRIAVNVSPIQLRYADFPEMVLRTLGGEGAADGKSLELEITESVIMGDIEANTERLQRLNDLGVTIAIDDFGTGYSSLRYLAKLPVDTLKIDRSFIVRMALEGDSMTLVSTMINLAHSFDLVTVAEGVDSEEQANLLRLMKCDLLQGYLFSKPVPAKQIEAMLLG